MIWDSQLGVLSGDWCFRGCLLCSSSLFGARRAVPDTHWAASDAPTRCWCVDLYFIETRVGPMFTPRAWRRSFNWSVGVSFALSQDGDQGMEQPVMWDGEMGAPQEV